MQHAGSTAQCGMPLRVMAGMAWCMVIFLCLKQEGRVIRFEQVRPSTKIAAAADGADFYRCAIDMSCGSPLVNSSRHRAYLAP
jgi:hypothetical protein